jgi:hypothetical protein
MLFHRGDRVAIDERQGGALRGVVYSTAHPDEGRSGEYLVVLNTTLLGLGTRRRWTDGRVVPKEFKDVTRTNCHVFHHSRLRKLGILEVLAEVSREPGE